MLPWELLVLALLPILARGLVGGTVGTVASYRHARHPPVEPAFQCSSALHLSRRHARRPDDRRAGGLDIFRWNADRLLGTSYLTTNEALMTEWLYVRLPDSPRCAGVATSDGGTAVSGVVSDGWCSDEAAPTVDAEPATATRAMQLVFLGLVVGILAGQLSSSSTRCSRWVRRSSPRCSAATGGFGSTRFSVSGWRWRCCSTLGSAGPTSRSTGGTTPPTIAPFYIAAFGHTTARTIDLHNDAIHIPRRVFFVYIFVVVLSFGVLGTVRVRARYRCHRNGCHDAAGATRP